MTDTSSREAADAIIIDRVRVSRRRFQMSVDGLRIPEGLTVVRGPNGAGKSTLLDCLAGLRRAGVSGRRISPDPSSGSRTVGYVPQSLSLPLSWKVAEYLHFAAWMGSPSSKSVSRAETVNATIAELELSDYADVKLRKLSGGYRRRALLGQALVGSVRLLIADEPFSALDESGRDLAIRALQRRAEYGAAVVVADHTGSLDGLATTLLYMEKGAVRLGSE